MKNLITSIKELLSKLSGGKEIKGSNLIEVIDNGTKNIAENQGQSGSGGSALMVSIQGNDDVGYRLNKTYTEIAEAMKTGPVILVTEFDDLKGTGITHNFVNSVDYYSVPLGGSINYSVSAEGLESSFITNDINGYPEMPRGR